ncbi:hypothetical protein GCM10023317_24230 [Actinopolymorpha pittospori]
MSLHPVKKGLTLRRVAAWASEKVHGDLTRGGVPYVVDLHQPVEDYVVATDSQENVCSGIGDAKAELIGRIVQVVHVEHCGSGWSVWS